MHITLSRSIQSTCLALLALLFVACTSIPISSMYSLSKIDPMTADPEQIRVAIRVDDSVNATRGSAQIVTTYQSEDGSIDEEHTFDVQMTSVQKLTAKLLKGTLPGEKVTVMSLTAADAATMRGFQQRVFESQKAEVKATGSFSLRFGQLCLDRDLPEGDVPLTLFLKTQTNEDYIVFIKTDLNQLASDTDSDLGQLPFCDDMDV
jgi:hypothetical protein